MKILGTRKGKERDGIQREREERRKGKTEQKHVPPRERVGRGESLVSRRNLSQREPVFDGIPTRTQIRPDQAALDPPAFHLFGAFPSQRLKKGTCPKQTPPSNSQRTKIKIQKSAQRGYRFQARYPSRFYFVKLVSRIRARGVPQLGAEFSRGERTLTVTLNVTLTLTLTAGQPYK